MSLPGMDDDALIACVDLVGRVGARGFEVGYLHDDVPSEQAGWYAHCKLRGTRITAEDHRGPVEACDALSRRLLTGAKCKHCGGLVTLSDTGGFAFQSATLVDGTVWNAEDAAKAGQCRWRRMGPKWDRGCEATHP